MPPSRRRAPARRARGFAVVATEVKALANQTSKATEEISAQIAGVQQATEDAAKAIHEIAGTINTINEISTTIAAAVEEQNAVTRDISANMQTASTGVESISAQRGGDRQRHQDGERVGPQGEGFVRSAGGVGGGRESRATAAREHQPKRRDP